MGRDTRKRKFICIREQWLGTFVYLSKTKSDRCRTVGVHDDHTVVDLLVLGETNDVAVDPNERLCSVLVAVKSLYRSRSMPLQRTYHESNRPAAGIGMPGYM